MAREIDIAISAKDNMSDTLLKLSRMSKSFGNDVSGLQQKLDAINKNKYSLNVDLDKARKELKEAKKEFEKFGDELSEQKYKDAQNKYDTTKENLKELSKVAKQTTKDMENLTIAESKRNNRASSGAGSDILSRIGSSGALSMLGDTLSRGGQFLISDTFGKEAGIMASNMISSASSGAAIGTMIAPGIGTAIGAVAGGLIGAINGNQEITENKANAFYSAVQSEYERVKGMEETSLANGSALSSARDRIQIAFETKLGKDDAQRLLGDVLKFANATPYEYDGLASSANQLLSFGVAQDEVIEKMRQLSDLSQGQSDIYDRISYAYGKMNAKQKVSLEELNMMTEAGVPILSELAKLYGTNTQAIYEMVSKGKLGIEDINKAMESMTTGDGAFAGMTEKISKTYAGLKSTVEDSQNELDVAMGKGYTDERIKGLEYELEYYNSESFNNLKKGYELMGKYKAELENEQSEKLIGEYAKLSKNPLFVMALNSEDGAKAGKMIAEAQSKAEQEYRKTDGYKLMLKTEEMLVESLKKDMAGTYQTYGYDMAMWFTKGYSDAINKYNGKNATNYPAAMPAGAIKTIEHYRGNAYGLTRVPYDNYPALLHEGERVLTKSQARSLGNTPNINININGAVVREENDIDKIATLLVEKIKEVEVGYIG